MNKSKLFAVLTLGLGIVALFFGLLTGAVKANSK